MATLSLAAQPSPLTGWEPHISLGTGMDQESPIPSGIVLP